MSFVPYLHFNGNAREAMEFYAEVFGATDLDISPYHEAPDEIGMPKTDAVLHAQFSLNGELLMAADVMPGMDYKPQASVAVSHSVSSFDEGQRVFDLLSDGGDVVMAYGPTFFTPGFGMCTDKFGTHWMVSTMEG